LKRRFGAAFQFSASAVAHEAIARRAGSHIWQPGESHYYEMLRAFAGDTVLGSMTAEAEARGYRAHEFGDSVLIERQPGAPRRYSTTPMIGPYPPWPGGSLRPSAGA
jgi:hypothetical protein